MRYPALLAAALLLGGAPASAQQFVLEKLVDRNAAGEITLAPPGTLVPIPRGAEILLKLTCPDASLCAGAEARVLHTTGRVDTLKVDGDDASGQKQISIAAGKVPLGRNMRLEMKLGGVTDTLVLPIAMADNTTPRGYLGIDCDEKLTLTGSFYNEAADVAQFVVSSTGTVVRRPDQPVDENDDVIVYVVGSAQDVSNYRVRRSSLAREGGTIIFQAGDAIPLSNTDPNAGRNAEGCSVVRADLGDFKAGKGEIELAVPPAAGTSERVVGKFDFTVNPLYTGAFSLGPVLTWNDDRTYTTLPDRTITESSTGPETHYVVAYTHFLTGRRDPEKAGGPHIDAVIAVQPQELFKHVYTGLSLDVLNGAVFLMGGLHGAEVTRINEAAGLKVGDKLPTEITAVPTQDEWGWGAFGGITIDLRAAAGLLRAATNALFRGS